MNFRKIMALMLLMVILTSCGVVPHTEKNSRGISPDAVKIDLSDDGIKVNEEELSKEESGAVCLSNDIVYYKNGTDFTYGEGEGGDMHTEEEAKAHSVIKITEPGDYILSGKLSKGQIAVDLGEGAEEDPAACVTLVLNEVDITCSVAPAIMFYNVYECGDDDAEKATDKVDTSKAGANIVVADGTTNTVNGSYVAKIYKSIELNEDKTEVVDSEKLHKYDAAINSKMSMNIYGGKVGDGILNVNAENEGISTDLHLTVYGGNINITSGNDGINTNEDGVSVMTVKSGTLNITVTGETGEGDGIDSNGWLIIEGGEVNAYACEKSMDSGLDADKGIALRGGEIVATGNMLDRIDECATCVTFMFSRKQEGGKIYTLKGTEGDTVLDINTQNGFSQLLVASDKLAEGEYTFWCEDAQLFGSAGGMGIGGFPGEGGSRPAEDMKPPKGELPPRGERPGKMNGEIKEKPEGEGFRYPINRDEKREKLDFSELFKIKKGANSFMVANEK